jgi:hypothetical protein
MVTPSLNHQLAALMPKTIDAFSQSTIRGAQHALADVFNPLRLNFFCTAMRILFEHMIGALAPVDQVVQAGWFVSERQDKRVARRIELNGSRLDPGASR